MGGKRNGVGRPWGFMPLLRVRLLAAGKSAAGLGGFGQSAVRAASSMKVLSTAITVLYSVSWVYIYIDFHSS